MQLDCSFGILESAYDLFPFNSQALGNILMRILQTRTSFLGLFSFPSFFHHLSINRLLMYVFSPQPNISYFISQRSKLFFFFMMKAGYLLQNTSKPPRILYSKPSNSPLTRPTESIIPREITYAKEAKGRGNQDH